MEKRRIELLLPLLSTLNRVAFDNLHKQVRHLSVLISQPYSFLSSFRFILPNFFISYISDIYFNDYTFYENYFPSLFLNLS